MNLELDIKAIPKLRFSKFKNPWVFSKIEDLFDFKNGLNKEKEFFGSGTPIINFMDVYKLTSIREKDIIGLVKLTDSEINRFSAYKGDVFFTRTSETIHDIGMSATLVEPIENCVFSGFVLRARPKTRLLSENFTGYLFSTQAVRKEITTKSSMTTRALTSGTLLNKVSFYYPEYKEQNKIAEFLSSVDKKIQLLEKKKEKLEQYKKGVIQKIFSQEIRFKDYNGNAYPDWVERKIKEETTVLRGEKVDAGQSPYLEIGDINPVLHSYILKDKKTVKGALRVPENTLLISTVRPNLNKIVITKEALNVSAAFATIKLSNTFLFHLFMRKSTNNKLIRYSEGGTYPTISKSIIYNMNFLFPSFGEQKKIADFLSSIDKKIETTSTQIDKTKEFKKGLLQQMFV